MFEYVIEVCASTSCDFSWKPSLLYYGLTFLRKTLSSLSGQGVKRLPMMLLFWLQQQALWLTALHSQWGLTHLARDGHLVRSRAASCCCRGWWWRCWHGHRLRCRLQGNQRDCDNLIISTATDTWLHPQPGVANTVSCPQQPWMTEIQEAGEWQVTWRDMWGEDAHKRAV